MFGDDILDWIHPVPAGSTLTEPRITPAHGIELHCATWTGFEKGRARSRVGAGVHFRTTAERSLGLGAQFGDRAYEYVQRHINGDVQH